MLTSSCGTVQRRRGEQNGRRQELVKALVTLWSDECVQSHSCSCGHNEVVYVRLLQKLTLQGINKLPVRCMKKLNIFKQTYKSSKTTIEGHRAGLTMQWRMCLHHSRLFCGTKTRNNGSWLFEFGQLCWVFGCPGCWDCFWRCIQTTD